MEKAQRIKLDNLTFKALGKAAHIEDMLDVLNELERQLLSDIIDTQNNLN